MLTVAVLISGSGSNLKALIEAQAQSDYPATIIAVGADRDAAGLQHARDAGIADFVVAYRDYADRAAWGEAMSTKLREIGADLVVLSGLMRLLPDAMVREFTPAIINSHPAYLPEFPGAHAVRDALSAGAASTGASVIIVDEGVDSGPLLARERVVIERGDTEELLHERIKVVERRMLIDIVAGIATGDVDLANPPALPAESEGASRGRSSA